MSLNGEKGETKFPVDDLSGASRAMTGISPGHRAIGARRGCEARVAFEVESWDRQGAQRDGIQGGADTVRPHWKAALMRAPETGRRA